MRNLLIAIPTLDAIPWQFTDCLWRLTRQLDKTDIPYDVYFRTGTLLYLSRDWLAQKAIDEGYSHVMWLDTDMVFDPDVVERLYAAMCEWEANLACGIFRSRHEGNRSCLFRRLETNERWEVFPKDIFEIDACGFACTLTETEMLQKVIDRYGSAFMPVPQYGEDLAFCERADYLGYLMIADPKVRVGHIGQTIVWPEQETRGENT